MKDQESMPCKYYAQFSRTAGDRKVEIAEKLAQVFDKFTDFDLETMNETDLTLMDSLNFKTAVFVNVENTEQESSARIMSILLNNLIRNSNRSKQTLFVIDNINADYCLISLPLWVKESLAYNMSYVIMCNDLASFKNQPDSERFFKNLRKTIDASVLMHHNDDLLKFENELPSSMDELTTYLSQNCMGQVIIPHLEISVQDQIF